MLIKEFSREKALKELMTIEDFSSLSLSEQASELRRAAELSGIDPRLISIAYTNPAEKRFTEPSSAAVMIITVISMLIGFALICTGLSFAINGPAHEIGMIIFVTGIIITTGIPFICRLLEKSANKKILERMRHDPKYADIFNRMNNDKNTGIVADTNYSGQTPPKKVVFTAAAGITAAAGAFIFLPLLHGNSLGIVFGSLIFVGFALLSISFRHNKNRDAAILLNLPSLLGLFLFISGIIGKINLYIFQETNLICFIIYAIILVLMPLIYNMIKRRRCTEKVFAICVYVHIRKGRYRHSYIPYWLYTCNGKCFIHKDLSSYEKICIGDEAELKINPSDPHDIYRSKLPRCCIYSVLVCAFSAAVAFAALAGLR